MVVIDPPFITKEVWEKYTAATEILLRDAKKSKILLTTIGMLSSHLIWNTLSSAID